MGNSIVLVIPSDIAVRRNIKANQSIIITIEEERPLAGELFGMAKGKLKGPTQLIKDAMRAGWN